MVNIRVRKEDFDKLSQMDRIEYRQRRGIIEANTEYSPWNASWAIAKIFFGVFVFCSLLELVLLETKGIHIFSAYTFFSWAYYSVMIFGIVFALDFLFMIFFYFKRSKLMKGLDSEYFSVHIKKKR